MSLFITSTSAALRHGVYAVERQPPATVKATGTGTSAIVEQYPWGPGQTVVTTTGVKNYLDTFAPAGMPRTGSGYLAGIRKAFPILKVVRVTGTSAVAASSLLLNVTPATVVTVTLNSTGVAGNSVTATVSNASDGDANHFNLAVTITSATGTTTDLFQNLNYSGTGADSIPDCTKCILVASITKAIASRPLNAVYAFTSGADGTITSPSYVGTAGSADKGVAKLEGDRTIDGFCCGDPGNSLRAAVNAGLMAHADLMTDRVAYINGNSGLSLAAAQTDVANYRSIRAAYIDVWPYIYDDTDGTKRLVPSAAFAMSVAAQLSPSTSIAWKATNVQALLSGIVDLESDRGDAASTNTDAGIITLQREDLGGYTFEAGVITAAPVSPAKKDLTRTRMGHFIARSAVSSLRGSVDSPNVPLNQQDEINAVEDFLSTLKQNGKVDPNNKPYIVDYKINDISAFNSQSDIDAGNFTIPCDVKLGSSQEKIFLSLNYGATVRVATQI